MKCSTYYPPESDGNLWRGIRWGVPVSLALWALVLALGALVVAVVR